VIGAVAALRAVLAPQAVHVASCSGD